MAPEAPPVESAAKLPVSEGLKRLLTGSIAGALALSAVLFLPNLAFFGFLLLIFVVAAHEYARIARHWAPSAPLGSLLVWMPLAAIAAFWLLEHGENPEPDGAALVGAATFLVLAPAGTVLFGGGTQQREALPAIGALAFGIPYFALPLVATVHLHAIDPWLLVLLMAIVALGDTAAFYVGSRIGRHKLAPVVSPNKSWEGAVAGFATAVGSAALWSWFYLGRVEPGFLAVAALTAVAAQVGDLVESILKRGAGIKDSSRILPGHGGLFDRVDALLFAAPVFLLGLWFFHLGRLLES